VNAGFWPPAPSSMAAPAWAGQLPKLYVYVDETGDRGFSKGSSPFFAMTAVLVPEELDWQIKYVVGGLRAVLNTPRPLHWVEHFKAKHPERRNMAAFAMSQLTDIKTIHIIADKTTLTGSRLRTDTNAFYNYTARYLLERVALAARGWAGGPRPAIAQLGAVKGMDHGETRDYLDRVRSSNAANFDVPWEHIKWPPKWFDTYQHAGIQVADIQAGFLNQAFSGDPADHACAMYLISCRHQIHRSDHGMIMGYGIKVIGSQ
jgi:hypothetical protein